MASRRLFRQASAIAPAEPAASAAGFVRPVAANAAQTHLRRQEILQAIERIPSLPTVVTEVLRLARTSTSAAADFEAQLRTDMALAGRLLKLVNSSFYALPNKIGSIAQAVALVGVASLRSLVIASASSGLLCVDARAYGFTGSGLWQHAAATGSVARRLAQITQCPVDVSEELFVGGLLGDIGLIVLAPFLDGTVLQQGQSDLRDQERALLGCDHVWVAEQLAHRWNLPESLTILLVNHHEPVERVPEPQRRAVAIVQLAERLVTRLGIGLATDHPHPRQIHPPMLPAAGVSAQQLEGLAHELPALLASCSETL